MAWSDHRLAPLLWISRFQWSLWATDHPRSHQGFGNLFLSRESVILFSKLWIFFSSLHSWWTWALFYKKNDSTVTHTVFTTHLFIPELIGALFISSTYPGKKKKKRMMGRTEDFSRVLLLLNFTDIQQNAYSASFFYLRYLSIKLSSSSKLNTC